MSKKLFLFILLLITTNSLIPKESNSCQKIECSSSLSEGYCIKVESSTSLFQECPSDQKCSPESDDPIQDAKCVPSKQNDFKRLPSLPCENNNDCLSDNCVNNKCKGKAFKESCISTTECEYGYTCRKDSDNTYKCLEPITTGNKCEKDTDCIHNCGCLNNLCTEYFSKDNTEKGSEFGNDILSFCKSGYSDFLGFCQNLTLLNETKECSSENKCKYKNTLTEEIIEKEENCLCGYNTEGNKYCLLGSGNLNYTKYISKLKEYYLNNINCHLSERTDEGCQKDLLSNDSYIIRKIHELINAKYWAKSNNKLMNAPICAYKVELPDFDGTIERDDDIPPLPGEGSCAIYSCPNSESNNDYCAVSNYKSVFNIKVSLYDICSENVFCKIGGEPNEIFYNKTNINSKCFSVELNKRYPGEKCEIDSECVYPLGNPSSQFHKCDEGRCTGMDEDGICEDNTWCLAGYYCDKFSGKCKEQKAQKEKCTETKECENNLICLNNECKEDLYSISDGGKVPEYEDIEIQKRFCHSGEVINNTCVSYNDLEDKLDDDKYRSCTYGSNCRYKVIGLDNQKEISIKCPCGYNEVGIGYCPHFHDYFESDRKELEEVMIKNYDNECHTENRYNCYEQDKEEREKELKNKIFNGHLFYNAVPCAKKVLEGNYLSIKKYGYIFGILLILL